MIDLSNISRGGQQWQFHWPFIHPRWSDVYYIRDEVFCERVQERANRRMKKKSMKLARAQGFGKRDKMPGAWPV